MTDEASTGAGSLRGPAEAIRAVCAAWESLDPAALASLFSTEGAYDDPLKAGRLTGQEAIREGNASAMSELQSCRIELAVVLEDGPTALAEGRFLAETAGGGRMAFPFALVAEVEGGRISRLAEYFDTRPLVT
jgi:ketosteroid isomerase-like protein